MSIKKIAVTLSIFLLAGCSVGGVELTKEIISCEFDGERFSPGETIPAGDGCNSCVCSAEGEVDSCTEMACEGNVGLANPAAVKCSVDNFTYEIREDADGGEYGVCIDEENKECDAWAYFRGECVLGEEIRKFEAELTDVSGGDSSGMATATYSAGNYLHDVEAKLPPLEEDFFYEGWLVKKLPVLSVLSSGVMVENEDGFQLSFESSENLTDHTSVVITLESGERDDKPEVHIIEGELEEIQ